MCNVEHSVSEPLSNYLSRWPVVLIRLVISFLFHPWLTQPPLLHLWSAWPVVFSTSAKISVISFNLLKTSFNDPVFIFTLVLWFSQPFVSPSFSKSFWHDFSFPCAFYLRPQHAVECHYFSVICPVLPLNNASVFFTAFSFWSILKMEAVSSSINLVPLYQSTWHHITEY